MKYFFYIGTGMQLCGLASVGLCFLSGIQVGDYGKAELAQFIFGMFIFYVGNYLKGKYSASP